MGQQHRPVQQYGVSDGVPATEEARRPAGDRNPRRQRLPALRPAAGTRRAMSTSSFLSRRPARLRLALIYSGLFLLAGAVLLAITYGLAASSLPTSASQVRGNPAGSTGLQACE